MANQGSDLEKELCWCMDRLKTSLEVQKLSERQFREAEKSLKTLQNPKAPLVKKRQLMRAKFGDYRSKMAAEEKTLKLGEPKFSQKHLHREIFAKSKFLKRHGKLLSDTAERREACDVASSSSVGSSQGSGFKFNFNVEEPVKGAEAELLKPKVIYPPVSGTYKSFHFTPSDNSFRFKGASDA